MPDLTQEEIFEKQQKWKMLAIHLREVSVKLCKENNCTEENHNCDSYAYVNKKADLLDICMPDYFSGSSHSYAGIHLPWTGDGDELMEKVEEQMEDVEDEDDDKKIII